jgi:hypothetical protein
MKNIRLIVFIAIKRVLIVQNVFFNDDRYF